MAPELDYWQITYAGYSHQEIYNDVDKTTDAVLKTWADLRTDAIWMYVDISHQIENFVPPEVRPNYFVHRGEKDYLMFKPIARNIDEAIALYEDEAWEKYTDGSRVGEPLSSAHAATSRVSGKDGPRGAGIVGDRYAL